MDPQQPPQDHKTDTQKLIKYQQFYRALLSKYHICCSCVYRIFGIMTPKFYSDVETGAGKKIMNTIISIAEEKCKGSDVKQSYKFMVGEFKSFCQAWVLQNQEFCWLCSGILQTRFLQSSAKAIIEKIKQDLFEHKQKYKLNLKIHNLFAIKFQVFCSLALVQLEKQEIIDKQTLTRIKKQLILPLFQKTGLDIKTVFKWKLSNIINRLPAQKFTLCSTINEDQQTVIASLEIDHNSTELDSVLTNLLGPSMHLEKTKVHKKGKIQLDQHNNYEANWTLGMITRISQITDQQWGEILTQNKIDNIRKIQLKSAEALSMKLNLQSQNIFFCGKYVKFSRFLSQTPWVINKERLTQSSLQQEVQKKILRFFYHQSIPENQIDIKFHAGGRQDIDVRMLKGGRPFVLEFVNPRKCLSDLSITFILDKIKQQYPQQSKNLPFTQLLNNSQLSPEEQQLIKCKLLQFYVNTSTELAKVNTFKKTTSSFISKQLKQAQIEKIKHYVCYIKSSQQFTEIDKEKLQSCYNLAVLQKTPVRVLHRRTLMYRDKIVHKMIFHKATRKSAVLEIWASAGTYIKQFVHGDLNRTLPNVGSIIGKQVDILQLDVGSLKEGQWVENDHQSMKLGKLVWEDINI